MKQNVFLPLILLFFTLATSRVQYWGLWTFLLKLAQCVACHLQQLIINLRGCKKKVLCVSEIDEGDLLFGQMNKSKQARSLDKIPKNDFSCGVLRLGKYAELIKIFKPRKKFLKKFRCKFC